MTFGSDNRSGYVVALRVFENLAGSTSFNDRKFCSHALSGKQNRKTVSFAAKKLAVTEAEPIALICRRHVEGGRAIYPPFSGSFSTLAAG